MVSTTRTKIFAARTKISTTRAKSSSLMLYNNSLEGFDHDDQFLRIAHLSTWPYWGDGSSHDPSHSLSYVLLDGYWQVSA
jgi:hypothetical protein